MKTAQEINVGIDTGKQQLDIYIRPLGEYFTVSNDEQGVKEAVRRIKPHNSVRIVIEATGRLETAFVCAAARAKLPVVIANAYHVHNFAISTGKLAKSDKLDAKMIAHYGEALKPRITEIKPENIQKISNLLARRSQLIEMRTMEKNRHSIMPKECHRSINKIIKTLQAEIKKVESQLDKLIEETPEWHLNMNILLSVKGVGKVLAYTLLSDLPELGQLNRKEIAALGGCSPHEPGEWRLPGQTQNTGRSLQSKNRTVYGNALSHPVQPQIQDNLHPHGCCRKIKKSGHRCLYEKANHHPQYHGEKWHGLG